MVMTMQRHGRLMLGVLSEAPPTDDEWGRWIELGAVRVGKDLRLIIEVFGSVGPNARQRQALTPWLGKVDMRTAVMSESVIVRGLVTALSWVGVPNSAFSPGKYEAAARYLELTAEELALAQAELPELRQSAGVRSRTSRPPVTPRSPLT